jgi:hypothetical protein
VIVSTLPAKRIEKSNEKGRAECKKEERKKQEIAARKKGLTFFKKGLG